MVTDTGGHDPRPGCVGCAFTVLLLIAAAAVTVALLTALR